MNFIDHLTGWADCYPLSSKRGETIADILQSEYFPRYGFVEVLISDNGGEFLNSSVRSLCQACGVEHRTTTPYRPQSNAKVERFHRTLKGILERLMAINSSSWESQLGPALAAYRNTVSGATSYTPFQALYGRPMRVPQTGALQEGPATFEQGDDRVGTLARVWAGARETLRNEREANEAQQKKKRLSGDLQVGDTVIVLIPGMKRTFQPRWDARWQVMRARHPVYWIRHLPTGQEKVLHREKLRWVPPDMDWGSIAEPLETGDFRAHTGYDRRESADVDLEASQPGPSCQAQTETTQSAGGQSLETDNSANSDMGSPSRNVEHPKETRWGRYPARKRRPPKFLGWEDWPTKRGRLAALDFYWF